MGLAQQSPKGGARRLANAAHTASIVIEQRQQRGRASTNIRCHAALAARSLLFWPQSAFDWRRKHNGNALTRDEHLAWCKRRALEYVDADDLTHAVASMASDLKTYPDTDNPALNGLVMIRMMYVTDGDKAAVQRWIEAFR
jgi:hypothetical protein